MKKLLTAIAIAAVSATTQAQSNFSGWYIGGELVSSTHKFQSDDDDTTSKRGTGIAVLGGYGIDYGNNFIGLIEGKLKFGGSKSKAKEYHYYNRETTESTFTKEKYQFSIAYLQGYQIENILPYIKISGNIANYDVNQQLANEYGIDGDTAFGVGIGLGVKYAIQSNVFVGMEYQKLYLRGMDENLKFPTTNIGLNFAYHF